MENVKDIATWFLNKDSMTHKKLQKLCYYAQAWYCALYDGDPLFDERIEAWVHGPVCPTLFMAYRDYRWQEIPQMADDVVKGFCKKVKRVLDAAYETYGDLTGDELEAATHNEFPWNEARKGLDYWEPCNNPISTQTMREFYAKQYENGQAD